MTRSHYFFFQTLRTFASFCILSIASSHAFVIFFKFFSFLLTFFKLLETAESFAALLMKHQQFERVDQFNIDFLKRFDLINYLCVFEDLCWYSSSSKSTNFFQFENVQFFDTTKKTCESSFVEFLWWKLTTTWEHVRTFV